MTGSFDSVFRSNSCSAKSDIPSDAIAQANKIAALGIGGGKFYSSIDLIAYSDNANRSYCLNRLRWGAEICWRHQDVQKKPTLTTTAEAPVADISLAIAIISLTTECRGRAMPSSAPISHHLALYRYWLAKRAGRAMPARSDIDPAEIPPLLPYLAIVDKVDGQFRYRLVGTVVASELGRDLTGSYVGSYVKLPEHAAAQRALFKRVFTTARPILTEGQYLTTSGAIHNVSRLMLPLADDGATVNMVFFTRIACFSPGARARSDWLKHITGNISDMVEVSDAAELEERCLEWERQCPE